MPETHSTVEFTLIPGHTAYRVSRCGRVQTCLRRVGPRGWSRTDHWQDIKGYAWKDWYRCFVLRRDTGGYSRINLHVLLMRIFVGPCPAGHEVCHRDDDKTNNSLDNLYYGTHSQNIRDAVRNGHMKQGRGEKNPAAKLTTEKVRVLKARAAQGFKRGDQGRYAREIGISQQQLCDILKGRSWTHVS